MRVLLVQNDKVSANAINRALTSGCRAVVDAVDNGEEAMEMVAHYEYDLVLLELRLPDMDGYDALRRIRTLQARVPVLAITGGSQVQAKVRAFSLGADDVMTKPVDVDELAARVQAITRRSRGHTQAVLKAGTVEIDQDNAEVTVAGNRVALTGKEYAILELLVMRKGMVLTKEVFLNHLYGGMDEPEVKIIDVFICKIRKKLADAGNSTLISTVWGRGYSVREPEPTAGQASPAVAAAQLTAGGKQHASHSEDTQQPNRVLVHA